MNAPVCAHCKTESVARFEITQFDRGGANKGTISTCSLVCLLQWAYQTSMSRGVQAAFGFKNAVTMLVDSLKGGK